MSNQANDMYWVTHLLSEMYREHSTPETDHDFVSDNFDALYTYMTEHGDKVELMRLVMNYEFNVETTRICDCICREYRIHKKRV